MTELLHSLMVRLKAARHRERLDRDLEEELAFHMAMKGEGAARTFGNPTAIHERLRDAWTFPALESVLADFRYAARSLRKSSGFATVAILSLAIAIGANTSIFTVFNALFLRSMPVRDPQELRVLNWSGRGRSLVQSSSGYGSERGGVRVSGSFSYQAYEEIARQPRVFSSIAAFSFFSANVVAGDQVRVAPAQLVSGRYFETLGLEPIYGRTFTPADDSISAPPVAVISWSLCRRLFAGDASAVGSQMRVDRTSYTVVGVLPPDVDGISHMEPTDLYVPIARAKELAQYPLDEPNYWWVQIIGRKARGVADAQIEAAVNVALERVIEANKVTGKRPEIKAAIVDGRSGLAFIARDIREFLLALLGMVAIVVLIACANVANLLLARGTARYREIAVRQSLGAGRWRVARYLLSESILLAVVGGTLGAGLAIAGKELLLRLLFPDLQFDLEAPLDASVFGFTAVLSILTALLFGFVPAIRATAVQPFVCLKQAGATATQVRQRLARGLVVVQVSAALVLVAGAGLFARTLINLANEPIGFDPNNLLVFTIDAARNGYKGETLESVHRRIQAQLEAVPGVRAVVLSRMPLLSGWMSNTSINVPGYVKKADERDPMAYVHTVGDRYFEILRTPVVLGRDFTVEDTAQSKRVAVINSTVAKKYFAGNPIGRTFTFNKSDKPIEIVGVAADAKYDRQRNEVPPTVYVHWAQNLDRIRSMHFFVRTSVDPASLMPAVRRAVTNVDSTLPVAKIRTQQQMMSATISRERTFAVLAMFFSAVALLLACIGIYGILAYSVSRRISEFGIRLALGATAGSIRWMVMRGTLVLIGVAIVIGVPVTIALGRIVENRLYGVKHTDAVTMLLAALVIVCTAFVAAWLPSLRASRSDPAVALRYE